MVDPLKDANNVAPRPRELFEKLSKCADGYSANDVLNAAINMFANALRQTYPTRSGAERAFDEHTAQAKALLLEKHYHGDGRRRNVFPHHQVIEVGPPDWHKSEFFRA